MKETAQIRSSTLILHEAVTPGGEGDSVSGLIRRAMAGLLLRIIDRKVPSLRLAMGNEGFEQMLEKFFPEIDAGGLLVESDPELPRFRADEYDEVFHLLADNRSVVSEESHWAAAAVAVACQGQQHLWQDLGLENRVMLSKFMQSCFGPLAGLNVNDMKWKKFLYKRLCELDGFRCRAPSCRECSDFANCYGPEV